jgi:cytochrome c1
MRKIILAGLLAVLPLGPAVAATEGHTPPPVDWSFAGPFGTYDRNQLKRGYQVYKEVCSACHSLKYVAFRNLHDPGGPEFSEAEAKALAASVEVPTIDTETGDAATRKATLADHFPSPFANEYAAKAGNNGALPPDLSLIAKGRNGGPTYTHALLNGFEDAPPGVTVPDGAYYNPYMAGGIIAMPPPLSDGQVEYAEAEVPRTVDQYAKDVSAFLMWTADPKMEVRKKTGLGTIIFLSLLSVLLFVSYRRVWRNVDH